MRTVDNLVGGRGATWNPDERVQAYTHPLWMLLLSLAYSILREPASTLLLVSLLVSGAFLVAFVLQARGSLGAGVLALLALLGSKSFADYSTSGLENPLTHLLLVLSYGILWDRARDGRNLLGLSFLAALGACNRLDSLLLFLPALFVCGRAVVHGEGRSRAARVVFAGFVPLLAWEAFSLFYYGSLVPNTAGAKLGTGLSSADYLGSSAGYFATSSAADPVGALAILLALVLGSRPSARALRPAVIGILLWQVYLCRVGGDFMLGRQYTPALVLACLVLSRSTAARPVLLSGSLLLVAGTLLSPVSPVRAATHYDGSVAAEIGFSWPFGGAGDERAGYFPFTGLFREDRVHEHVWVRSGRALRARAEAGDMKPVIGTGIGMLGFFAGPGVRIIDPFGLADPLLARLPMQAGETWKPGHFVRRLPAGYRETRRTGENLIQDPELAAFYVELRLVLAGELFGRERLRSIWRIHFGAVHEGFERYRERYALGEVELDATP